MDEEDRPGSDGDPAERTDVSDGNGRDGSDLTDASDPTEVSDPTNGSESTEPTDESDLTEPTDESGQAEPIVPGDPSGESRFPTDEDESGPAERGDVQSATEASESFVYRFRHDDEGALMWIREMLSSVAIVLVIGLLLFGISGVWPPMVAVESGSMEPNMEVGDLVFVTEPGRLAPDAAANDIGVVTYEAGRSADYRTFGSYGSVVIYRPPGRTASPIIHRAMFHVEEGENWYDRADDEYHNAAGCAELRHCPAPHSGFITLGDNNGAYDQANGLAAPVRAEWVTGVARVRVPYLGYVRLIASGQAELGDVIATTVAGEIDSVDGSETSGERSEIEERKPTDEPIVSTGGSLASSAGGSLGGAVA
ncbi:MAG: S26 family signal peptidase [Halorubrum sp.]|uniref:S26 family signal peptidase n=1 Tax=Halorubrum sp. TaxID=1879286 RepID=UPI003970B6E7